MTDTGLMPAKFKPARINAALADIATDVATADLVSFNQFVNQAVKEKLERLGKWPPPAEPQQPPKSKK